MPQHKINNMKAMLMISVAMVFELNQAFINVFNMIPVIGWVMASIFSTFLIILGYMTFWFWFALNGVYPFRRPKGVALFGVMLLIELVPFVNLLPGMAFWVWRVIVMSRFREKKQKRKPTHAIRRFARNKSPQEAS